MNNKILINFYLLLLLFYYLIVANQLLLFYYFNLFIFKRIISVKTIPLISGVDLAREERVNKCNDIIALFEQIKECPSLDKMKGSSREDVLNFLNSIFYN